MNSPSNPPAAPEEGSAVFFTGKPLPELRVSLDPMVDIEPAAPEENLVGFFKGKPLPKLRVSFDPMVDIEPAAPEEDLVGFFECKPLPKHVQDIESHVTTSSVPLPNLDELKGVELKVVESVSREIEPSKWDGTEEVHLRKMTSQGDGYGDFDPVLVTMFKEMDTNNNKSIEASELFASMKRIRLTLGIDHPKRIGDIVKVCNCCTAG